MDIHVTQANGPEGTPRRIAYAVIDSRRTSINSTLTVGFVDADLMITGSFQEVVSEAHSVSAKAVLRTLQQGHFNPLEDCYIRDCLLVAAREHSPRYGDLIPPRVQARRFVKEHLSALSAELITLKRTGTLGGGPALPALASVCGCYCGFEGGIQEAERLVVIAALEAAAVQQR